MKLDLNLDALKEIALDVWDDLGRTRLAGVAVGLALALLAMTGLLLRSAGPPAVQAHSDVPAAAATTAAAAEDEVTFTVPGEKPLKLADVDLSAPRDPFRSLDGLSTSAGGDQTLLPAEDSIQDAVFGPEVSSSSSSGGGVSAADYDDTSSLQPLDDLASATDPTTETDTDEPTTTQGSLDEPRDPTATPVTDYSYAADIQFGRLDDLKRYATVQRLGLVPSRRLPLLMYLGVSTDHETAVFMVDSRLSQGGEGRCVPKASQCTFIELRATPEQDEHHFRDADGNEYLLRLRRLVRTTASAGSLGGEDVSVLENSPPVVDGTR
jgi:hypothetical protein